LAGRLTDIPDMGRIPAKRSRRTQASRCNERSATLEFDDPHRARRFRTPRRMNARDGLRATLPHFVVELRRFTAASEYTAQQICSRAKISKSRYYDFLSTDKPALPNVDMLQSIIKACAPKDTTPETFWERHRKFWLDYRRAIADPDPNRKWLLIVEDQLGDQLTRLFGEHQPVLVENLAEFWHIKEQVPMFDAVLVDLHLQPALVDKEGYRVLDWLSRNSTVPTVAMTVATPQDTRVQQVIDSFNLIDFCTKSDGMSAVHDAVRLALSADADGLLIDRLEQSLVSRRTRAMQQLRFRNAQPVEYEALDAEIERVRAVCRSGSLAQARAALRRFDESYSTSPV
jgi:hypothetical protein